jgi:glutathione synthase/RimK-type ligase-like ATP-grasp enzyme
MILILTDRNDSHSNHVIKKLDSISLSYYRLNLDVESLLDTKVKFENNIWHIEQRNTTIDIDTVECVWNRRTFVELLLEETYDQSSDFKIWKNEWNKTLLGIYSKLRHKRWLNPWRKAYEAENKYLQMEFAIECGLTLPPTIVSNDKTVLTKFISENGNVVLKLMHQDFYRTDSGEYKGLYVNQITEKDIGKFKGIDENPIVLQKYIEKKFEVRYTVVGTNHYACMIDSQKSEIAKIDWRRYDIPNTPHTVIDIPQEVKTKVNLLMKKLGIEYGALDFIIDKSEDWIFLEVNSMGQFLWIEDLSGAKISDGIIEWFKKSISLSK